MCFNFIRDLTDPEGRKPFIRNPDMKTNGKEKMNMKKLLALLLALCMVLALAACGSDAAQPKTEDKTPAAEANTESAQKVDWPKKNITIIVGYGAGGDTDLAARVLADALSTKLGVSVIVENLTGGSGVVGRTELLARGSDGYTLMFDQPASSITQVLMGNTTYELEEAGEPIAVVGTSPLALTIAKDNPKGITNMDEFIAYAKDHPGELTYAVPGQFVMAHLAALNAFGTLGINVTSVPTGGTADCVTETLGKHVDAMCAPYSGVAQYVESGDMILLAASAPSEFLPEGAPLMDQFGVADFSTWYGVWTGEGVDPAVITVVANALDECLKDEALLKSLADLGIEVNFKNTADAQAQVAAYADIIKNALIAGGALSA